MAETSAGTKRKADDDSAEGSAAPKQRLEDPDEAAVEATLRELLRQRGPTKTC